MRPRCASFSTRSPSPTRAASARAAEQCGVSQPSLSAQLAQLEGALGVRLFERDRRRVLLTPAGEDLIERARRVLVDADDLVDAARRLGDPLAGTLSHRRHPDHLAVPAAGGRARDPAARTRA